MAYRVSIPATFAAAAAALVLAAPAGAHEATTVEGWELNTTGDVCSMTSTFSDDVMIGLIWTPGTGNLSFVAGGPKWSELREKKTAALELSFDGGAPYSQWADEVATVVSNRDGNLTVIGDWGPSHKEDLAKTVASASKVTVKVGGRALGTYDLAGSPAAYGALMRCGGKTG